MSRYIIRSEISTDAPYCVSVYNDLCYQDYISLMNELFKYKDEIDYNSWIYVVTSTHENKYKPTYERNEIKNKYEVVNPIARRYIDATTTNNSSNYTHDSPTITIPRTLLLFNKKNECKCIEVSTKLLKVIYEKCIKGTCFFNLGHIIFFIDCSYSAEFNQICTSTKTNDDSHKVPMDLIPFISKNIPDVSNYNQYTNYVPESLLTFINSSINKILKDLLITEKEEIHVYYKYVEMKKLISEEKAKRKAQLLEELRLLDSE